MLAHRWENPSTAQRERQAISRARRLCKGKRKIITANLQIQNSKSFTFSRVSTSHTLFGQQFEFLDHSDTFLSFSRIVGLQSNFVKEFVGDASEDLAQALIFSEKVVSFAQRQSHQSCRQNESGVMLKDANDQDMMLRIRWDPSTMRHISVVASQSFLENLAGMCARDFNLNLESCRVPLPCPSSQWLCYLADGALCVGEGRTSWIR